MCALPSAGQQRVMLGNGRANGRDKGRSWPGSEGLEVTGKASSVGEGHRSGLSPGRYLHPPPKKKGRIGVSKDCVWELSPLPITSGVLLCAWSLGISFLIQFLSWSFRRV